MLSTGGIEGPDFQQCSALLCQMSEAAGSPAASAPSQVSGRWFRRVLSGPEVVLVPGSGVYGAELCVIPQPLVLLTLHVGVTFQRLQSACRAILLYSPNSLERAETDTQRG